MSAPDLQALIELSDDDLCDLIEMMDAMEVARIMRRLATAPTLPGAGGGDARDAKRYRWLLNHAERIEWALEGDSETKTWNSEAEVIGEPDDSLSAAIDAALPPQQGG